MLWRSGFIPFNPDLLLIGPEKLSVLAPNTKSYAENNRKWTSRNFRGFRLTTPERQLPEREPSSAMAEHLATEA